MIKTKNFFKKSSIGNFKTFSQVSVLTCRPGLSCFKYCYDNKAKDRFHCEGARFRLYFASLKPSFVKDLDAEIKRQRNIKEPLRPHEVGDYYSVKYILKIFKVARLNPGRKFFGFTKRDDLFTKEVLKRKPSNFTLYFSIDGVQQEAPEVLKAKYSEELELFDGVAFTHEKYSTCRKQKDPEVKCMEGCKKCLRKGAFVFFKLH